MVSALRIEALFELFITPWRDKKASAESLARRRRGTPKLF